MQDQLWFRIKGDVLYWSQIFEGMENLKKEYKFVDYLVNDCSLGEVYLGFARERKMVDFGNVQVQYFDKSKPSNQLGVEQESVATVI